MFLGAHAYTLGLQPLSAIRVTLDVIVPSSMGLTPEKWNQTATLYPLDWLSNYSLLRLWHMTEGIHEFCRGTSKTDAASSHVLVV